MRKFASQLGNGSAPALTISSRFQNIMLGCAFGGGLLAALPVANYAGMAMAIFVFFVGAGVGVVAGAFLTERAEYEFPRELSTLGDLSIWIKNHRPDLARKSQKGWTREQVAGRIREIVIDILCCEKQYHEGARFVQDLGLS